MDLVVTNLLIFSPLLIFMAIMLICAHRDFKRTKKRLDEDMARIDLDMAKLDFEVFQHRGQQWLNHVARLLNLSVGKGTITLKESATFEVEGVLEFDDCIVELRLSDSFCRKLSKDAEFCAAMMAMAILYHRQRRNWEYLSTAEDDAQAKNVKAVLSELGVQLCVQAHPLTKE